MNEWILIEDKLPDDKQNILAYGNGEMHFAWYQEKNKGRTYEWDCDTYSANTITHWMPLPNPPQGK